MREKGAAGCVLSGHGGCGCGGSAEVIHFAVAHRLRVARGGGAVLDAGHWHRACEPCGGVSVSAHVPSHGGAWHHQIKRAADAVLCKKIARRCTFRAHRRHALHADKRPAQPDGRLLHGHFQHCAVGRHGCPASPS